MRHLTFVCIALIALIALSAACSSDPGSTPPATDDDQQSDGDAAGNGDAMANADDDPTDNDPVVDTWAPLIPGADVGERLQGQVEALGVSYYIALNGQFPSDQVSIAGSAPFVGEIMAFAPGFAPSGWRLCDGALLAIADYDTLFTLIGTTYGGDGQTTFALPNLVGRVPVGAGVLTGATAITDGDPDAVARIQSIAVGEVKRGTVTVVGLRYLIATTGYFPSPNEAGGADGTPALGQIILFSSAVIPKGFAACEGQILSINSNIALFTLLGNNFGGDGQTTFALPDLRARAPLATGALSNAGDNPALARQVPLIGSADLGSTASGQIGVTGLTTSLLAMGTFAPQNGSFVSPRAVIGQVIVFAGNFAYGNSLPADGRALPINQNTALFLLLGTTYGGDAQTTFNIPQLSGRLIVGSPSL